MTISNAIRIEADAIIVTSRCIFAPGQIVIEHGRIVDVTEHFRETADVRLDHCVLLPGLVNAHTHLEFSDLPKPLPAGAHFPDWIQLVLAQRQPVARTEADLQVAITAGLIESSQSGVAVLGDIVTAPWSMELLTPSLFEQQVLSRQLSDEQQALLRSHLPTGLPQVIAFLEQLGLSAQRRTHLAQWRTDIFNTSRERWPDRLISLALSPHAPYSTVMEQCQELSQLAATTDSLLAMHVLESPAEREWIDAGTGPFADMISNFGMSGWRLPSNYVPQLCASLCQAKSALLIHGNYFSEAELDLVASYQNLSLVYCPRTHQHFGHRSYPLSAIHQRGIRWLLGTDSRSTNPDLDLWQEARQALSSHPWLAPSQAFDAITAAPATALCIEQDYGSLQVGRVAAINCIELKRTGPIDKEKLIEQLLSEGSGPRFLNASC